MVVTVASQQTGEADPIISRLASEDTIPWYKKPNLRGLYLLLLPTAMGIEITSGFNSQMINALQIVGLHLHQSPVFHNPAGEWKGFISASYALGAMLSLPLVPIVNERFGRRWSIFLGSWVMVIGDIIQMTAKNTAHYIIARVVLGFGIPTCIVAASALIGELGYPKERPIVAAGAWRLPSILQACPSLIQISLVFDLVRTVGKRRRLAVTAFLGLATQWSGNTLISYYLGDILKMIGKTDSLFQQRLNLGLSAWYGVSALIAAMLVNRFKRRSMYLACTLSLLMCYISWTISAERSVAGKNSGHPNGSANVAVIFFIFAYAPCYNIGYNALTYTYLVELWPHCHLPTLSGFFTTFVNSIGMDSVGWKYLISYCVFLAFETVFVYFFFASVFEDKALAQQAVDAVEKVVHHPVDEKSPSEKAPQELKTERIESRV
ncbi:major facilitator superfamily domain-containing protein [Auriculariales sp. MPI-PUGE-AT-0066]|nr:major facilitator superfamily domain-containing protein [Auriculariales sp. MPI-PUGE-AT-0066]